MVPGKRRGGCRPLESGRKGSRNKSSASNRGRASARFYSRTLNSIAIGFSGCLCSAASRPASCRFLLLLATALPRHPPARRSPLSLSVRLLEHLYRGTPRWFLTRGNLITSDTIKYPGDERERALLERRRRRYELRHGGKLPRRGTIHSEEDCASSSNGNF